MKPEQVTDVFAAHRTWVEYRVVVPSNYYTHGSHQAPDDEPKIAIGVSPKPGASAWLFGVWVNDVLMYSGDDLRPEPEGATHKEMMRRLCAALTADGENIHFGPGYSPATGHEDGRKYPHEFWHVLGDEYERFGLVGNEEEN